MAEYLSGGNGSEGSEDREKKIFYELDRADPVSFHVESGSGTATTSGGYLPPTFESLPPPPYVARNDLSCYSVMSPGSESFIHCSAVPAGNVQAMNTYYVQQQPQLQHPSVSPLDACGDGVYGNANAHLLVEPASSAYCDTMPPSIANVTNGYWYPPGTDSPRFSSKLLHHHNRVCVYKKVEVVLHDS